MISGFTIIRNGIQYDYPFIESLRSMLPIVDELVINVGHGTDDTLNEIKKFITNEASGKKVTVFESHWPLDDPEKRKEGKILSEQTNLALEKCNYDWCLYLQADEVLSEQDHSKILNATKQYANNAQVDGLLFDYIHFYGSFDIVQNSRSAYRREVRVIKKSSGCRSIGDAQSFRHPDGTKPSVVHCGSKIYHYGWVRTPDAMKEKTAFMDTLYHGKSKDGSIATGDNYRYKKIIGLFPFLGNHPKYMQDRIQKKNWKWDIQNSPLEWKIVDLKKIALNSFEQLTGIRLFEYRSYKRID